MARRADVFLHNIRPGKPEALGLGWKDLAARNPRLVYAAISGLGHDGPDADQRVYDFVVQARVGMVDYQRSIAGEAALVSQVLSPFTLKAPSAAPTSVPRPPTATQITASMELPGLNSPGLMMPTCGT